MKAEESRVLKFRNRPPGQLTGPETAARAGVEYEKARRIWRALGLPEVDEDALEFDDSDVQALRAVVQIAENGIDPNDLTRTARPYGKALSAVADAEARLFARNIIEPLTEEGVETGEIAGRVEPLVEWLLDTTADLLDYVHRRHLRLAVDGLSLATEGRVTEELAVGFVDLVGFSRLSEYIMSDELGEIVDTFEEIAISTAAESGVRVVKVIGDAVMLVARDPERLVRGAASIVEAVGANRNLPKARAGADFGELIALSGDYFGRAVNVAARATGFAKARTLVVSEELLERLESEDRRASQVGVKRLKGVGRVSLFKLNPAEWASTTESEAAKGP
ncbi:MAG: adenylate cyclase regulatory domain-containing protein [Actinomycetota bacterium]